jgi:isopentenyl diphosphate isomerase/L-lactate dehydrogenase-like FMN-dependent dehydrogenase
MIDLSKTIDLSTTYLGLKLKSPLVASSSPMCGDVGNIRRLEDAARPQWCCNRCSKSRSITRATS